MTEQRLCAGYGGITVDQAAVYQLVGSDGQTLYIGCAGDVNRRRVAHSRKPWSHLIARMDVIATAAQRDALELEALLITKSRPPLNKRRNSDWYAAGKPAAWDWAFSLDDEVA